MSGAPLAQRAPPLLHSILQNLGKTAVFPVLPPMAPLHVPIQKLLGFMKQAN